ncbi:MAG: purine-binding chemotaxis protein CheW [Candidatus Hydrogenedentes bacterium]|nr:purine-binding chemotaxis protein CheW [Candidatus Hydrogenedentota bacterium]
MAEMDSKVEAGGALSALRERAGQYLTFELDAEVYGLEILKVQEIIGMMAVTRVPRTPAFVRGVINLRGKVIPVIDLRLKFAMAPREDTTRTCIIVVQVSGAGHDITMGIIVDQVSEVLDIVADQMEPAPSFGQGVDTEFIFGMGKVGDKVIMLLDVDKVLSGGELALFKNMEQDE